MEVGQDHQRSLPQPRALRKDDVCPTHRYTSTVASTGANPMPRPTLLLLHRKICGRARGQDCPLAPPCVRQKPKASDKHSSPIVKTAKLDQDPHSRSLDVLQELWSAEHVKGLHNVPELLADAPACSVSSLPDRIADRQAVRKPTTINPNYQCQYGSKAQGSQYPKKSLSVESSKLMMRV